MPANGTELPVYHLKCIAPEPQDNGTTKEEEAPTSTFNSIIHHIKIFVITMTLFISCETSKLHETITCPRVRINPFQHM